MTFDPTSIADALEVLRTELETELSDPHARVAVSELRQEIRLVIEQASTWALERGSYFDFVDPPEHCDAVDCILMLRRLSYDLRRLVSRHGTHVVNDNATSNECEGEDDWKTDVPRRSNPEGHLD